MNNTKNLGYVKLAVALILSLLLAASPAVAESEYMKKLWAQSESETDSQESKDESAAGSEADSEEPAAGSEDSMDASKISTKELSQQSANPVGRFAYIFTQFAATWNDGDANTGDSHLSGNITFQPIIPIPVYGKGLDEWRIVTRPTINLAIEQPVPQGPQDNFDRETEISDLLIPLPLALPDRIAGRWLLALGPSFSIPMASDDDFSAEQWTAGLTGVFGYIAEDWMAGCYPQTYFGFEDEKRSNDKSKAEFGNMFYWFFYNITDEWQIGTNPTIQWNNAADKGNKWNVPVGFVVAKVDKWWGQMIRWEFGVDYSVIKEDDYGEVARVKLNLIPVVGRPIKEAIFGGGD